MMAKEFNVVIEKDADGYFVATVPALRGCHTQAKSLDVATVAVVTLEADAVRPLSKSDILHVRGIPA